MTKSFTKYVRDEIANKKSVQKKYLRDNFLLHGEINNPNISYHAEYNYNNLKDANKTIKELLKYGIVGRLSINANNRYIVYIIDSTTILEFLKVLGAYDAVKKYKKIVDKKLKIRLVQSQVNFETANIKKSANASLAQLEDIKKLLKKYKLKDLDDGLKAVIKARKKYPTLNLSELADKMGNISKSALNHRFIKIRSMI